LSSIYHHYFQGYLQSFCDILFENLSSLPGDARTQIGFIAYDSRIHFYDLTDRSSGTFRIMIVPDIDDTLDDFLPMPDGLLVNLAECRPMIESFLNELPKIYQFNDETDSVLGTALQLAEKLLHNTGGRVTVVQTRLPNRNPGALNGLTGKEVTVIGPTSDFYKKLALDYASQQIACDLFLLNSDYIDLATLSKISSDINIDQRTDMIVLGCISKYSGGEVKYYPNFHHQQTPNQVERYENDFRRYLQRKIGFEAVMRLRTPPSKIHCFVDIVFMI
jgi:protein transport protein SEC24